MQAKDRELAQTQEQLRQSRQQVIFNFIAQTRADDCLQEQSSRRKIGDMERQLRSSEALVADLQKRVSESEAVKAKVRTPNSW